MKKDHYKKAHFILIIAVFLLPALLSTTSYAQQQNNEESRDHKEEEGSTYLRRSTIVEIDFAKMGAPAAAEDQLLEKEGTNVRANVVTTNRQNETSIDFNPLDPLNLVGGANDYRNGEVDAGFYYSRDGGVTWGDGTIFEPTFEAQGDPAVAFCANGYVFYSFISFDRSSDNNGLFAARSIDGGENWPLVTPIAQNFGSFVPFEDKEYIACDTTSSPYQNTVYVSWTHFPANPGRPSSIYFSRSTDDGVTFTNPMVISDNGGVQGSVPAVGPNGEVYVIWQGPSSRFYLDVSMDGGVTFGADKTVAQITGISDSPCYRRNSFPTFNVDRSADLYSGSIYVAWSDNRNGDPDIYFTYSRDGGNVWSAAIRLNTDHTGNGRDQFFPWLSVDDKSRVNVIWYDARNDPGNQKLEVWGAVSRDGGQSFDTNFLISDVPFDPCLDSFLGDYNGVVATPNDRIYPLWTDLRSGEEDAYTNNTRNFALDEVKDLLLNGTSPTVLSWDSQDAKFGVDTVYDIVSGLIGELSFDKDFSRSACLVDGHPDTPYDDTRINPPEGDAYYYLVRSENAGGAGSFGDGTEHPNARDDLDEAPPCL